MSDNQTNAPRSRRLGIVIGSVALVVLVAVFALVYFLNDPTRPADPSGTSSPASTTSTTTAGDTEPTGAKAVTVKVVLADGTSTDFTYHTDAVYLGELIQEEGLVQGEMGAYGLFIQTVNGVTADEANQEWWCITKGGEMVMTGADVTPLADGDQFELTLTVGY